MFIWQNVQTTPDPLQKIPTSFCSTDLVDQVASGRWNKERRRQTCRTKRGKKMVQGKTRPFWGGEGRRKIQRKLRGEICQCLCGTYLGNKFVVCPLRPWERSSVLKAPLFQGCKGMVSSFAQLLPSDPVPCVVCGRHLQQCLLLQRWRHCFWLTYSLLPPCSWLLWKEAPLEEQRICFNRAQNLKRLLHKTESHISLCVLYGYFPNLQCCLQSNETVPSNNRFKR